MVTVRIPTPLRTLTGGRGEIASDGKTIAELLEALEVHYPGFRNRLFDEAGSLRRFVNIYLNEDDIRFHDGIATPIKPGDEISIVPAIAGGRG